MNKSFNFTQNPTDLLKELVRNRFLDVSVGRDANLLMGRLVEAAFEYFARPTEEKLLNSTSDGNIGFRQFAREYSQVRERPDLNECFTYWASRPDYIPNAKKIEPLLDLLTQYTKSVSDVAERVLGDLQKSLGGKNAVNFLGSSYIQMNYYPEMVSSHHSGREYLQDIHEDGHLMTLLFATSAGLEAVIDGKSVMLEGEPGGVIVMPGSLMTAITGGLVEPLFHRVKRNNGQRRLSVMYFVNPNTAFAVEPFISNYTNSSVDIRKLAVTNPHMFGLPDALSFND